MFDDRRSTKRKRTKKTREEAGGGEETRDEIKCCCDLCSRICQSEGKYSDCKINTTYYATAIRLCCQPVHCTYITVHFTVVQVDLHVLVKIKVKVTLVRH
jgi:hypothetical protein